MDSEEHKDKIDVKQKELVKLGNCSMRSFFIAQLATGEFNMSEGLLNKDDWEVKLKAHLKTFFKSLDKDNSNSLSKKEVANMLEIMGEKK